MNYKNNYVYKNNDLFGSYVAGLWEGDGNINLPKNAKPSISITFHKCDTNFANYLLNYFALKTKTNKVGAVYNHKKRNACYLTLYSVKALICFVNLVRSKLRTPKAYIINLIIDWLNQKQLTKLKKVILNKRCVSSDAWLAGFIDADGSFAIRQTFENKIKSIKKLTECALIIYQRKIDPKTKHTYTKIFKALSEFLRVNLNTEKARNPNAVDQYKIKASSALSKKVLRSYLDKYPLLSSKRLDYESWCSADDLMLIKMHYSSNGAEKITKLKRSMNSQRTYYNWDHLNF